MTLQTREVLLTLQLLRVDESRRETCDAQTETEKFRLLSHSENILI